MGSLRFIDLNDEPTQGDAAGGASRDDGLPPRFGSQTIQQTTAIAVPCESMLPSSHSSRPFGLRPRARSSIVIVIFVDDDPCCIDDILDAEFLHPAVRSEHFCLTRRERRSGTCVCVPSHYRSSAPNDCLYLGPALSSPRPCVAFTAQPFHLLHLT
jgi:hypothetical protein